jgi:serine/threonine protein kinase
MTTKRDRSPNRDEDSAQKRKAPTSKASHASIPKEESLRESRAGLSTGDILTSPQAEYRIETDLGEGGRGRTFLAVVITREESATSDIPTVGTPVVIKTGKIDEARGWESTQYFINFVDKKLVEEKRALAKLSGLRCVAQVIDSGTYRVTLFRNEVAEPRFLVQQYIKGYVLSKAKAIIGDGPEESFAGIDDATKWFDIAINIVDALLAVHQRGVVHNDIWHRNVMLDQDGQIVLIDFGEAIFRTAHRFLEKPDRKDPWIAPEWISSRMRPSRRADVFAVGGVLFWLACGSEPPMPDPNRERAKQDIEAKIKERNPALLAQNILIADVIARCRRYDRNARITDTESLRRELITYGRPATATDPMQTGRRIVRNARSLSMGQHRFLARWADIVLRRAERHLEDLSSGVIDISGGHEEVVSGAVDAIASLKEGDEYLALSTSKFWKPGNIGVRGRFFSMTHQCAQRGVKIRRVFLLTETDERDEDFWPIMRAQTELQTANDACSNGCLQTRFSLLPQKELLERLDRGDHCGYLISGGDVMDMVPVYDAQDVLRSVRLIVSDVASAIARLNFNKDFDFAEPLTLAALTIRMRSEPGNLNVARAGS